MKKIGHRGKQKLESFEKPGCQNLSMTLMRGSQMGGEAEFIGRRSLARHQASVGGRL
jgi:hypothetical protein